MSDQLVLVRHGATDWAESGRHTGRTDVPLNDAGRAAARGLSDRLATLGIAQAFSSPLLRAVTTAELAGFGTPVLLDELQEWDYGDYEGLTTPEIDSQRPGWELFRDGCPGGEDADSVGRRADAAIATIAAAAKEATVAVFSHGHILRVLAARWLGLDPDVARLFLLSTATVSVLSYEHAHRVIALWNS